MCNLYTTKASAAEVASAFGARWLHGSIEDVAAFQERCFPNDMTLIERTSDPWFRRKEVSAG